MEYRTIKEGCEYFLIKGKNSDHKDLLKMFFEVYENPKIKNKEKIEFVAKTVDLIVTRFEDCILNDNYPSEDISQIFGISNVIAEKSNINYKYILSNSTNNFEDLPIHQLVFSSWKELLKYKLISKSQIIESLLKGNLISLFENSINNFANLYNIKKYDNYIETLLRIGLDKIKWDVEIHNIIKNIHYLPVNKKIKIKQNDIIIFYGFEEGEENKGYFLEVCDKRLSEKENSNEEVNRVLERVKSGVEKGSYFSLFTGNVKNYNFGLRVGKDILIEFMRLYKVPEMHIQLVEENKGFGIYEF